MCHHCSNTASNELAYVAKYPLETSWKLLGGFIQVQSCKLKWEKNTETMLTCFWPLYFASAATKMPVRNDERIIHDYAPTRQSFGMPKSSVWKYFGFFKNGHEYDRRFTICKSVYLCFGPKYTTISVGFGQMTKDWCTKLMGASCALSSFLQWKLQKTIWKKYMRLVKDRSVLDSFGATMWVLKSKPDRESDRRKKIYKMFRNCTLYLPCVRICREELMYPKDASTSRMRSHLKNEHREIFDTDKGFIPRPPVYKPLGNPTPGSRGLVRRAFTPPPGLPVNPSPMSLRD